ncbi:hypothetical protein DNTS_028350 [Danionella cerebrum]|uniref:ERCC4 domain-containing protein n=1 Tax=Danionella cerebrum TaxID=2873325 RepID=A0A553R1U6_9TELE|nr:hypothetical protein DNTS_028350 [Danionella translucida]
MFSLQRANTWEISESENESEEKKLSSCSKSEIANQDISINQDTLINELEASATSPGKRRRRTRGEAQDSSEASKEKQSSERIRRKKNLEELKEAREAAEAKRTHRRKEREKLREQKALERQWKKEAVDKLNQIKPENLIKRLRINVHAGLLQDSGCDLLLRTLDDLHWKCIIENEGLPNSISWTRSNHEQIVDDLQDEAMEEDQVLMVISKIELENLVMSYKTEANQSTAVGLVTKGEESLFQQLTVYLSRNFGKVVTILVVTHQRRLGSWDVDEDDQHHMDIEELSVHLQLYWNVAIHFLFGWQEMVNHVVAVTKALSKRPYKAMSVESDLGFCLEGSWSAGVRVDRDGHGLALVWMRQIQQLNRVSETTAKTVISAFPSPALLMRAYEDLPFEQRRMLLADLIVVGGAREKRVGPELSGRIHRLLTSQNPQLLLD